MPKSDKPKSREGRDSKSESNRPDFKRAKTSTTKPKSRGGDPVPPGN